MTAIQVIVALIITHSCAIILGALIYRNNTAWVTARANALISAGKTVADKTGKLIKAVKSV